MNLKNIFDTHAHYDDEAFSDDADELLEKLPELGVTGVITCGVDLVSSAHALDLAKKYPYIYAALGFHPENIGDERKGDLDLIEQLLETEDRAVAVGEIGLDYHYEEGAPKGTQIELFSRQVEMANRLSLPIIVHDRDAHEDTMNILKKYKPQGVVHCFSGSVEMAREVIKLGMYIGLGGVTTFKNARKSIEVAKDIPLDRLLLETDAPYMAPVPFRGKRNDSSLIAYSAQAIAEARNMDTQELLNATAENAKRLFKI